MRAELAPAVILHRRPYRESSLLVECFTRDYGRIGLVARGARRPRARWRGLLEPLQPLRLSWSGRGELHTLTGAENPRTPIRLSGDNLYAGFYASELLLRVTAREDPHRRLFDAFMQMLEALTAPTPPAPVLRVFERDLLAAIGYALPLRTESTTGAAVRAQADYYYHPQAGLRAADSSAQAGELRISGAALLALADGQMQQPEHAGAARRLLTAALAPQLGGRPLKTVRTLQAMRRLETTKESL